MGAMTSAEIVLKFERLINSRSADAVCSLLTEDSVFIDSLGNRVEGVALLRSAWQSYFNMVPDYTIDHTEMFTDGDRVAMFGTARGTFSRDGQLQQDNRWNAPAAWRAVVRNGKIALWQVFADNEPLREVMKK
jgi:ketosteroid isomerase-like protein